MRRTKHVGCNIRAPPEKWEISKQELEKRCSTAKQIITDESLPLQDRYDKWCKQIDSAARESIGKTTFKEGHFGKVSKEMKDLRQMKRDLKKRIRDETDKEKRKFLILDHKKIQEATRKEIVREKTEQIKRKFEQMTHDTTDFTFYCLLQC